MPLTLSLVSRDDAGTVFAAAYGNATARDFPTHEHVYFDTILGKEWMTHRVVLDIDAVPFLDSSAIGWLIHSQKLFRENGGLLALHSVQPHVRNILSLLRIDRVVPIGKDAADATEQLLERLNTLRKATPVKVA
jgi:anti-anti-sigma factor